MPLFLFLIYRFNNKFKILICFLTILLSIFLIVFVINKGPTIDTVKFFGLFYGKEFQMFYFI